MVNSNNSQVITHVSNQEEVTESSDPVSNINKICKSSMGLLTAPEYLGFEEHLITQKEFTQLDDDVQDFLLKRGKLSYFVVRHLNSAKFDLLPEIARQSFLRRKSLKTHKVWIGRKWSFYQDDWSQPKDSKKEWVKHKRSTWIGNTYKVRTPLKDKRTKSVETYRKNFETSLTGIGKNKKVCVVATTQAFLRDFEIPLGKFHPETKRYKDLPVLEEHPKIPVKSFETGKYSNKDGKYKQREIRLLSNDVNDLSRLQKDYDIVFVMPKYIKQIPTMIQKLNAKINTENHTKGKKYITLLKLMFHGNPLSLSSDAEILPDIDDYVNLVERGHVEGSKNIKNCFKSLSKVMPEDGTVAFSSCHAATRCPKENKSTADVFEEILPNGRIFAVDGTVSPENWMLQQTYPYYATHTSSSINGKETMRILGGKRKTQ